MAHLVLQQIQRLVCVSGGLQAYELVQSIGQGAYGAVYKCVSRQAQECVAVKAFFQAHEQPEVRVPYAIWYASGPGGRG